jgi:hypothetical protein
MVRSAQDIKNLGHANLLGDIDKWQPKREADNTKAFYHHNLGLLAPRGQITLGCLLVLAQLRQGSPDMLN